MLLYMVNSGTCNNYITFRFFSASFLWKIQYYLYNHVYHVTHFMQDLLGAHHWFGHGHAIHIAIVCTYRDVTAPRKSTGRLLLLMDPQEHWIIGSELQESCQHQYESIISCQLSTATTSAFFLQRRFTETKRGPNSDSHSRAGAAHRFQGRQGPISQSNRLEVARLASSHESNLPADFTPKLANLVEKLPFVGRCSCPMEILIFLMPFKIMSSSVQCRLPWKEALLHIYTVTDWPSGIDMFAYKLVLLQ